MIDDGTIPFALDKLGAILAAHELSKSIYLRLFDGQPVTDSVYVDNERMARMVVESIETSVAYKPFLSSGWKFRFVTLPWKDGRYEVRATFTPQMWEVKA